MILKNVIYSAIFENLPETSSSSAESNDISFVFLSHGESPQMNFWNLEILHRPHYKKNEFLAFFYLCPHTLELNKSHKKMVHDVPNVW
jgi:hypothetical protein